MPAVYSFPIELRWIGGANEKERIEQAIRAALTNHPVFQMKTDRYGMHFEATLCDILHGRYHDVKLLMDGEDIIIRTTFSRILGDGQSAEILLKDLVNAYRGEPLAPDDYWGYLEYIEQQKHSAHYAEGKAWLEHEFADQTIPVRPTIDRRCLTTFLPPKVGLYQADYTDLHEAINTLAQTQFLSVDGLFSLCAALAIADYCGTDEAALTWAYEGRERPEEQHIFGSLHRDVPFIIRKSRIENRESAIKIARNQIRSGIAHSDYPYTLTKPHTARWNYAVNVLRVWNEQDWQKLLPESIEFYPSPPQKYAYALLDVEIHESEGRLELWYRYSATHYKAESIHRFASLIRHYAEWLLTAEN